MDKQLIVDLQEHRVTKQSLDEQLEDAMLDLKQTPEYARVRTLQAQLHSEEDWLKQQRQCIVEGALKDYASHQQRSIAPGVSIRVEHKVVYDPILARSWCLQHYQMALELDADMFEKEMKHLDRNASETVKLPPFVKVEDDPKVTIASRLDEIVVMLQEVDHDYAATG